LTSSGVWKVRPRRRLLHSNRMRRVTAYHRQNLARARPYVRVRDRRRSVVRTKAAATTCVRGTCACVRVRERHCDAEPAPGADDDDDAPSARAKYKLRAGESERVRDGEDGGGGGGVGLIRSGGTTHSPSPPHDGDVLF